MDRERILEEVTRTSIKILLKEPYYSHVFACMNKEVVEENHPVKTMAVGLLGTNHVFYINQKFWDTVLTSPEHRYGVTKHEVLHIVFKHTLVESKPEDRLLTNIAMDLVVNQYILRSQLPEQSIFLETFLDLRLEKEKSWRYYFEKLKQLKKNEGGKFSSSVALKKLKEIEEDNYGMERHVFWDEIKKLSEMEKNIADNILENLLILACQKTPPKVWGNMPGSIRSNIENMMIKPEPLVNWRRVIKLFTESSSKTKIKNTMKRPSKRFGTVPGIKIKKLKRLLIAIDTSGSVSNTDIEDFFSEIYHVWRQGAEIKVVECDVKIQNEYDYKGITPKFVMGRGGTHFDAPIEYANDNYRPDGLIYFTDGYANTPSVRSRCDILWVITKGGLKPDEEAFKNLPGRKAKLIDK